MCDPKMSYGAEGVTPTPPDKMRDCSTSDLPPELAADNAIRKMFQYPLVEGEYYTGCCDTELIYDENDRVTWEIITAGCQNPVCEHHKKPFYAIGSCPEVLTYTLLFCEDTARDNPTCHHCGGVIDPDKFLLITYDND